MRLNLLRFCLFVLVLVFAARTATGLAQSVNNKTSSEDANESSLNKLRDEFAKRLADVGVNCRIAPPTLRLQNVKSWGNYDPDTNTLTTPLWSQLDDEDKSLFTRLAGPTATEDAAHAEFETGIHHWVFVHEMGHWAQTCQDLIKGKSHYAVEYGANRIALAYWRERDPEIVSHMVGRFQSILNRRPTPVPSGQSAETFFNENYEKLAGTPAYTWFQSYMVNAAAEEKPQPSFANAVGANAEKP